MTEQYSDEAGHRTLAAMATGRTFNHLMYETVRPYCTEPTLEIGSGIGNISQFFVHDSARITLSDLRTEYCDELKKKFATYPNVIDAIPLDLVAEDFETRYATQLGKYASVFALNVIEHIENDVQAMQNIRKLLAPGGNAVILVPSYQWLFCRFDVALGHHRRFTKKRLVDLFEKSGYRVTRSWYFNSLGLAGWFLFGKLLQRSHIQEGQMRLYNLLVPLVKFLDFVTGHRIGLSVIAVGTPN